MIAAFKVEYPASLTGDWGIESDEFETYDEAARLVRYLRTRGAADVKIFERTVTLGEWQPGDVDQTIQESINATIKRTNEAMESYSFRPDDRA